MLHFSPPLVSRTFDVDRLNEVVNHPAILPGLGLGQTDLDMGPLVANPRNIAFIGEHGGAIMVWSGPSVYDAHDFILPAGRGKWAMKACREILRSMFAAYGARMIWAQTPAENRGCRMFNRMLGFHSRGIESAILIPGTPTRDVEIFVMEEAPCL